MAIDNRVEINKILEELGEKQDELTEAYHDELMSCEHDDFPTACVLKARIDYYSVILNVAKTYRSKLKKYKEAQKYVESLDRAITDIEEALEKHKIYLKAVIAEKKIKDEFEKAKMKCGKDKLCMAKARLKKAEERLKIMPLYEKVADDPSDLKRIRKMKIKLQKTIEKQKKIIEKLEEKEARKKKREQEKKKK